MWDFLFVIFVCDFCLEAVMFGAVCLLFFFLLAFHALRSRYGFPAYFSTPTPSFLSATYRLASGVGFSACFSFPTPTLWVFSPAFHSLRPRYGFSRLLFCSLAQFSFRNISISFRSGFSRSLFTPFAHAMGFPAYFSAPTPSLLSATYR